MTTTAMDTPDSTEVARTERTRSRRTFRPNVDIFEREDELVVLADMPGVGAEDIDVRFENGSLTIFGRVDDRQQADTCYLAHQYGLGDYLRTFEVGEVIDTERITAEISHGVLTLHLPKTERIKPRRISVQAK